MLHKQAKVLRQGQISAVLDHLGRTRQPIRNRAIFLLSLRAGLRAKEIADLTWSMVTDPDGAISKTIWLTNAAAKGRSGGVVPIAKDLQRALAELSSYEGLPSGNQRVVRTERSSQTSAQVVVNLFREWYQALGFDGCSSHSGRRTFITMTARNIGRFGGSLRDVQALARHSSLAMTQRYIEIDSRAMQLVVDGW
jgi:integrase/recombinase XerD